MEGILCVFSSLLVIEGILVAVYSEPCRKLLLDIVDGFVDKILAVIALMLGVALLIAAFYARCPVYFWILSGIVIIKSLLYLLDPGKVFSKFTDWFLNAASDRLYRFVGILEVMLGTVSFFFV